MPELDSVRGIAILLVVFFHGFRVGPAGLSGLSRLFVIATAPGWMGVNLFFVLSGFLITGILLDSKVKPHYYRNFYIRRALRILPAYYLLLVVLWVVPRIGLVDHRRISFGFIALSFIYLSNVTNFFGVVMQYGTLWSLAVEEHFYLLWPTAVRYCSRKRLAYLAAAVFLGCPLLRALAYELKLEYGSGYTWLVADGLAAGALLALFCRQPGIGRRRVLRLALLCMGSAFLLFATGLHFGILLSGTLLGGSLRVTMLNLFFSGALAATLLIGTSRWRWLVQWPALQFFGEISYGLYLIHMLVFDVFDHFASRYFPSLADVAVVGHFPFMVVRFTMAAGIAVVIAFISRRTIEARFLDLKDRWTAAPSDAAGSFKRPLEESRQIA
jgi:peptidoglycan/LPS O-acetylase OafA/YrhL